MRLCHLDSDSGPPPDWSRPRPPSRAVRVRHGAWRRLKASSETGSEVGDLSLPPSPRASTLDHRRPHPPRISAVLPIPPWERLGLSSRPASGACHSPQQRDGRTGRCSGVGSAPQSYLHMASVPPGRGKQTQTQRCHVEMGAETAEMLLRAEDHLPPPPACGQAPLGSGGSQACRHRAPDWLSSRPRGRGAQLVGSAATAGGTHGWERPPCPRTGHGCTREGDSHTVRGSVSLTAVAGRRGSKGAFQGPGRTLT